MLTKKEQLYSGKAKTLYATDNAEQLIVHFRDDTSAFNGEKMQQFAGKGAINNNFNAHIMRHLADNGVATHFIKLLSPTDSLVKKLAMFPIECVIRNIAAGSICRRLGIAEGTPLSQPIFEFFLKNDELGDPMINESHILAFNWANPADIEVLKKLTFEVNQILKPYFDNAGMLLVDYKVEFGRFNDQILLGDEFTPDGCRIWDKTTQEKFDKDRFRRDLGDVTEFYKIAAQRLGVAMS